MKIGFITQHSHVRAGVVATSLELGRWRKADNWGPVSSQARKISKLQFIIKQGGWFMRNDI